MVLDNNTNKVVWIGVAVGIVSLLGVSALLMFPAFKDTSHTIIRHESLRLANYNQNVLDLSKNNHSILESTAILKDNGNQTTLKIVNGSTYQLGLDNSKYVQGIFFPYQTLNQDNVYDAFIAGDKFRMSADVRIVNGTGNNVIPYYIGAEGANAIWTKKPVLNKDWQSFEMTGTRTRQWGAPVVYFVNKANMPVTIEVKNVALYRE